MILVGSYTNVAHKVEPSDPELYACNGMPFIPHLHKRVEVESVTMHSVKAHFGPKARLCRRCFPGQTLASSWT